MAEPSRTIDSIATAAMTLRSACPSCTRQIQTGEFCPTCGAPLLQFGKPVEFEIFPIGPSLAKVVVTFQMPIDPAFNQHFTRRFEELERYCKARVDAQKSNWLIKELKHAVAFLLKVMFWIAMMWFVIQADSIFRLRMAGAH